MASSLLPHPLHPTGGRVKDGADFDLSPARQLETSSAPALHGFVFQKTIHFSSMTRSDWPQSHYIVVNIFRATGSHSLEELFPLSWVLW